jgi:AraC-like DNA-binding protein
MALILDTRRFAAVERADVVRQTIASTVVNVDIDFPAEGGPAAVYGSITDLGQVRICSVRSNATKVERTAALARDDLEPRIFLALQVAGFSLIVQGGREAVLGPGDLAFSESTSPYTLLDGDGIRQHFFSIPVAGLALPHDMIRQLAAVTLSPKHPVADLAVAYFGRIAARPDIFTRPGADAVGQPSIELVRALITTHLDASLVGKESLHATLQLRLLEYMRAHLADPGLNAAQIAAAHHISVRHLYNVLGESGILLGDWIRERRLEKCRDALARPAAEFSAISHLARQWGFRDVSSFGRSFRAAYGMSPREWRKAHAGRAQRQRPSLPGQEEEQRRICELRP